MGAPKFDDAPTVPLQRLDGGSQRVTMIYPYYQNPVFLAAQLDGWRMWDESLQGAVSLIIVDDGSPRDPAEAVVREFEGRHGWLPLGLRLFRIEVDVRWNWLAARNIGAHHARDSWLLLTDMDHVVPQETMEYIVDGAMRDDTIYVFHRVEHTGESIHPHPNSLLLRRSVYWRIGGYDEALSGHYGTDGDWRRRCAAAAPIARLPVNLVRHEYQADSSTTDYLRKQPQDAGKKAIIARRGPGWRPLALSFPYHEVNLPRA